MISNYGQIPPPTTRVICPCTSEKIVVNTLAPTFLIGSSSFFQVTRTTNKSGQSLNFGQMGPRDTELWCQKLVFAQYLENGWTELNQILYTLYHWQDLFCYCKRHFLQICNDVAALDWYQKLVFAQCLENGWTEFNKILYTHCHWQDLYWYCKASFFHNCSTELRP